jgi:TolB protein
MYKTLIAMLMLCWQLPAQALTIEITEGVEGALPIAVVPFGWQGPGVPPTPALSDIVDADLQRSGRFKTLPTGDMLARPHDQSEVDFRDWRVLGMDYLVIGQLSPNGPGGFLVRFQLFDVFRGEQLAGFHVPATERNLRATGHQISDIIYEKLLGERGAFATRIAYITSVANGDQRQVELRIADADGHAPQTIVRSEEPLMSPAWSPDGKRLAYVSFEQGKPGIYVQEVLTGRREQVASYPGINGAPAWSPDGRKLALTLSKDGNPDIFVLDLASRRLTAVTRHYGIDTEAAWSPDGRYLVFTSDRGGAPQIYRSSVAGGSAERLTFEHPYNASASYSPDGKTLTLVTRVGSDYRIGLLDLASKRLQVLSNGRLDESPSFAPNGGMIIYASKTDSRGLLEAVSVDGRVRQRLALDTGDVREPAWAPYSR